MSTAINVYNGGGMDSVNSVGVPVNPAALTPTIDGVFVGATTAASAGVTSYRTNNSTQTTMPLLLKVGATNIYGYECYNISSTSLWYLRLYDSATTVTVASTAINHMAFIPPISTASLVQPAKNWFNPPIPFTNGLAIRLTGGFAENDNTSVQTAFAVVQLFYK